ncbi:MAG: cohesin domain-containing protein [Candidatus Bathyarchaeota archaeon]|nr:cohesin domain-containing protein [Candidatus Bathyarchaeota archaeon]
MENTPKPLGYFTVELKVENAFNVYGWQAVVEFDPQKIMIIDVTPGDFLDKSSTNETSINISDHGYSAANKSFFVYHVSDQTKLIIAQTLLGEEDGKSGDGTLAYIKFGYLTEEYQNAFHLVFNNSAYKTLLLNNKLLPTNGQIGIG